MNIIEINSWFYKPTSTLTLLEPISLWHICAVWSGSILLADQLQILIVKPLQMIIKSSKMEDELFHLRNSTD